MCLSHDRKIGIDTVPMEFLLIKHKLIDMPSFDKFIIPADTIASDDNKKDPNLINLSHHDFFLKYMKPRNY